MQLILARNLDKDQIFNEIKKYLEDHGFKIITSDQNRPWGGFYVIDEEQSGKFIEFFFQDATDSRNLGSGKISPKILIVEKEKRLSWQYHHRRAELWKVIAGEVGVITSQNDEETPSQVKKTNDIIKLKQGERHRLIGLQEWGVVAEIWQHIDALQPSDENDIIRIQDDFGR